MKWLFKHSAVISISAALLKRIDTAPNHTVGLNTSRYRVQRAENSGHHPQFGVLAQFMLFKVQEIIASKAGLVTC